MDNEMQNPLLCCSDVNKVYYLTTLSIVEKSVPSKVIWIQYGFRAMVEIYWLRDSWSVRKEIWPSANSYYKSSRRRPAIELRPVLWEAANVCSSHGTLPRYGSHRSFRSN
jgi:hypothetical protein